jgi:hypothetical protein
MTSAIFKRLRTSFLLRKRVDISPSLLAKLTLSPSLILRKYTVTSIIYDNVNAPMRQWQPMSCKNIGMILENTKHLEVWYIGGVNTPQPLIADEGC